MVEWTRYRELCAAIDPGLTVETVTRDGLAWLEISIPLGPVDRYERYIVLRHNFDLAVGQLVQIDDRYLLRQSLPLDELPDDNVRETAEFLVAEVGRSREFFEAR